MRTALPLQPQLAGVARGAGHPHGRPGESTVSGGIDHEAEGQIRGSSARQDPIRDMLAGDRNLVWPCSTSSARIQERGSSREPWEMLYQDLRCCEDQP